MSTWTNQNVNKAVVVMGAGDATGSAIAKRFAREGMLIVKDSIDYVHTGCPCWIKQKLAVMTKYYHGMKGYPI